VLAGGLAATLFAVRPRDDGGGYDPYFRALNDTLRTSGPARPSLVLDLDRLDRNIDVQRESIRAPKHFRVVDKSLPSLPLLQYIFERARTNRVMSFHQPFMNQVAAAFPGCDMLLGKPMPVKSAEQFYADLTNRAQTLSRVQWLVDSAETLRQYLDFFKAQGHRFSVNVEIDVGLHRRLELAPIRLEDRRAAVQEEIAVLRIDDDRDSPRSRRGHRRFDDRRDQHAFVVILEYQCIRVRYR